MIFVGGSDGGGGDGRRPGNLSIQKPGVSSTLQNRTVTRVYKIFIYCVKIWKKGRKTFQNMNFEDGKNMVFTPPARATPLACMSLSASAVPATLSTVLTAAQQTYKPLCHSPLTQHPPRRPPALGVLCTGGLSAFSTLSVLHSETHAHYSLLCLSRTC